VAAEQAVGLMLAALRALGYIIVGGERGTVVVREWGSWSAARSSAGCCCTMRIGRHLSARAGGAD
jgi:hypothetical protein